MANTFHLALVTPERTLFSGEAEAVEMRADGGDITFLANHEDFIGAVDITVVKIVPAGADEGSGEQTLGGELRFAVHGGFVHVEANTVTLLAGVAEPAGEIDVERARRALEAAGARTAEEGSPSAAAAEDGEDRLAGAMLALLAPESAEAARRRAVARLEAAEATP